MQNHGPWQAVGVLTPSDNASLRIGFALPHLRAGGIEVGVLALANELTRRGHQVHLFLRRAEGELLEELDPRVRRHDAGGRRAIALSGWLARGLKREGIALLYSGTNAMNLGAALALRHMTPDARPAHMLSEHSTPAAYLSQAKWPMLRRLAMRGLYPRADCLVAPLEGLAREWLDHLGLDHPRPATLPNPVLPDAGEGAESVTTAPRQGVIAVGRLHHDKGFDRLIAAMALLRDGGAAPDLTIWGEGAARPGLERHLAELGLSENIRLPGVTRELPARLGRARLLVVPSRREGFGNVVVEALAAATPVLATDCAGPAHLLAAAGGAGRLLPRDAQDLPLLIAQAMTEMLADDTALAEAARRGTAIAAPYRLGAATDAFEKLARDLLRARPAWTNPGDGT